MAAGHSSARYTNTDGVAQGGDVSCTAMFRPRCFLLFSALLAASSPSPMAAQDCGQHRTALVLSGGGAKGLAHIGVLRALDSLGIRPDLIVGTSMGAIVGALYASGYSGRELDSLARTLPLSEIFRAYEPQAPRSLGILQPLVVWEQGKRGFYLKGASIIEAEVNALVNAAMLNGNLLARGNFDSLVVPFRAVATDLAHREVVVLSSGDLAQAVRASAAIPLVFAPEPVDGRFLIDGGLSANIPVGIARAEGARVVIVSDATEHPADSIDVDDPLIVADRLVGFLFDQPVDSLRRRRSPDPAGHRSVQEPRLRSKDASWISSTAGARRRIRACARFSCRSDSRPGPTAARDTLLPRRVTGLTMSDANASERLALERLLGLGLSDTLDVDLLRTRLRYLGLASEAYRSIWLRPGGGGDSVTLRPGGAAGVAPSGRTRPRLRQRAGRKDVGGSGGPAVPRAGPRGERRRVRGRASAGAVCWPAPHLPGRSPAHEPHLHGAPRARGRAPLRCRWRGASLR